MAAPIGALDVSRETYQKLEDFAALVRKWTRKINLVSAATLPDLWDRHIVDSAQIFALAAPDARRWLDIGSGGGFPGIVVAILAADTGAATTITLVESDARKSAFLRTAIRELALDAVVLNARIEQAPPHQADVVSARALSSLDALMPMLHRHLLPEGTAILHKGRRYQEEVAEARRNWRFDLEERDSMTDPEARILVVKAIERIKT